MTKCTCGGPLSYSREDDADWCILCGRLFYHFTPNSYKGPKSYNARANLTRGITKYIIEVLSNHPGPMHIDAIYEALGKENWTYRYLGWVLKTRVEFSWVERGWWQLDEDFVKP